MGVTLRPAVAGDVDAVWACDALSHEPQRRATLEAAVLGGRCMVAVDDAGVVGFVTLDDDFFAHAFVQLVVVAPGARRRGVALALLAAVEHRCTSGKLFTSTNASNGAAQALFARAGFRRSGVIENLDAADPELVFFKPLPGGGH